ncbi:TfoX/Sxy family protein [Inquilinus sp. YAF38]|uniref:TfoX/Sxy family protein n=1 Tax=Inquilinus sp. YAF38 TaxID=3233084 RepID=UPI003F939128
MARDPGLEELVREALGAEPGLDEKRMFGGLAWLLHGNLLCGARVDSMLVRLGKGNDGWALEQPGIATMVMQDRPLPGWIRAGAAAYGDDALRRRLLDAALAFVRTLPPK